MEYSKAFGLLLGVAVLYCSALVLYRVYFSPIAHIPGPFWAKATYWYEFYYDVVRSGNYMFRIRDLHEQYGPIMRINPHEVHIADADYYDEVFAGSAKRRDKWAWSYDSFGVPKSMFCTIEHDLHRTRRGAVSPFFSKAKVRELGPRIDKWATKLFERIEGFKESGETMPLMLAFTAVTNDIVAEYAFGQSWNRLSAEDFAPNFHYAGEALAKASHMVKQFPFMMKMFQALPVNMVRYADSNIGDFMQMQQDVQKQVVTIQDQHALGTHSAPKETTIFNQVIGSDLPPQEKHYTRLWQDGQIVVVAGTITTASVLALTTFYLLTQEKIARRLKAELSEAIPNRDEIPDVLTLENLPYLTAVLHEGLRLSNGVCTRLQRVNPTQPMMFVDNWSKHVEHEKKEFVIPPGTPISLTGTLTHCSERYFEKAHEFIPERWLDSEGKLHRKLDKYFVPFSRGSRACLGINLAWTELYLITGIMFRRYSSAATRTADDSGVLELVDTTWEDDIEIVGDGVTPITRRGAIGIKIKVKP